LLVINFTNSLRKDNPEKMGRLWVCKYAGNDVLNRRIGEKGNGG